MTTSDTYRVIQWATGSIGQIAIRHFIDNPTYQLVGAYVTSQDKAGCDAGVIAGVGPVGVTATGSMDEVLAIDADCVNYAPLYADIDDMCAILRSRKNIVTPVGFIYPKVLPGDTYAALDRACRDGGTTLHGAGIHPGFAGDLLPMVFARLSNRIDQVTVQEVADLAPHPSHKMNFEGLGFGRDPAEARADHSPLIKTMEAIFRESMLLLADGLGVEVERTTTELDVAVVKRDVDVRSGHIPKGTVGGMRHEWISWSAGVPVIVFRSFWKMDDDLDPNWGYGTIKYSLEIKGDPALQVGFEPGERHPTGDEGYWGRVWTAMNSINAIPAVVAAEPGIKTHLDLPLVQSRGLVRSLPARGVDRGTYAKGE